jgi:hypothetical protein
VKPAGARERQRKQELIGQVFSDRSTRGEVTPDLVDQAIRHLLRAHAALTEARKRLGDVF